MTTRTCATCAAFYPDPDTKNAAQSRYIEQNRDELMASIRQHATAQERQDAERDQLRDAEVGAERIMQRVMVKMRKGSAP